MRYRKNYTRLPFILISLSVLFQLLLLGDRIVSLWELNEKYAHDYSIGWCVLFTVKTNFYLTFAAIAFISLLIYYLFRRKYMNVLLSKIHVCLVFTGIVAIPILEFLLYLFNDRNREAYTFRIGNIIFDEWPLALSLLLIIIANIFFILTLIKSSTLPKAKYLNESTGLLDEFAQ